MIYLIGIKKQVIFVIKIEYEKHITKIERTNLTGNRIIT